MAISMIVGYGKMVVRFGKPSSPDVGRTILDEMVPRQAQKAGSGSKILSHEKTCGHGEFRLLLVVPFVDILQKSRKRLGLQRLLKILVSDVPDR